MWDWKAVYGGISAALYTIASRTNRAPGLAGHSPLQSDVRKGITVKNCKTKRIINPTKGSAYINTIHILPAKLNILPAKLRTTESLGIYVKEPNFLIKFSMH